MNATKLRADLYAVLDQVLETGQPVTIERKGRRLKISIDESGTQNRGNDSRWPKPRPDWVNGSVEDLVNIEWTQEWRP